MSWQQYVTPNLDPYVYVDGELLTDWYGWCLATVVCAYNSPYSGWCAWVGWQDYTQIKHEDRNFPVGVYFPIWFSGYSDLGHVAFAYVNDNGAMNIWTSPYTHIPYFFTGYSSVDDLANGYGLEYVGWSEDIAGMRVIADVQETPPEQPQEPVPTPVPPAPIPEPTPTPTPEPTPTPDPAPEPTTPPVQPLPDPVLPEPGTVITPDPQPTIPPKPDPTSNIKQLILAVIVAIAAVVGAVVAWLHS